MAKAKTRYVCQNCNHTEPKWLGRCPSCGEWNVFVEEVVEKQSTSKSSSVKSEKQVRPVRLDEIEESNIPRLKSEISEFDRVLGGGLLPGAAILVGGEPGIGKSTLMLQICDAIKSVEKILYIAGEESVEQIKMRAKRLGVNTKKILLYTDTNIDKILKVLEKEKPGLLIVDSIQTIYSTEIGTVPGTVNQIKYSSYELIDWAKSHQLSVLFVAHVTKGGVIAGPKVMEHIVDTVLYFDQSDSELRFLRASKNRFGSVDEIGIFSMEQSGLQEVRDPASMFIQKRSDSNPAGVAIVPVYEGSRVLLIEIQALTVSAKAGLSRVYSDRIDSNRISRISAILEKHVGIRLSDQDIYVNVAGGMRLSEVAADLAIAAAIYSARTGLIFPKDYVAAGELTLSGEIRPVQYLSRRVSASIDLGFKKVMGAKNSKVENNGEGFQGFFNVNEFLKSVFSN